MAHDPKGAYAVAALLNGDSNRWQALRARSCQPAGLVTATVLILKLALVGFARVLRVAVPSHRAETPGAVPVTPDAGALASRAFVDFAKPLPEAGHAHASKTCDGTGLVIPRKPATAHSIGAVASVVIAVSLAFAVWPKAASAQAIRSVETAGLDVSLRPMARRSGSGAAPAPGGSIAIPLPFGDGAAEAPPPGAISLPLNLPVDPAKMEAMALDAAAGPVGEAPRTVFAPLRGATGQTIQDHIARLRGERADAQFLWILPPGAAPDMIEIATQSSAFVWPPRSMMKVAINGTEIGAVVLDNLTGFDADTVPIPDSLSLGTRNTVSVEITQTNRLYCGAQAAYQLWSDVELRASGAPLPVQAYVGNSPAHALARIATETGSGSAIPTDAALRVAVAGVSALDPRTRASRLASVLGGPLRFGVGADNDPLSSAFAALAANALSLDTDAGGHRAQVIQIGTSWTLSRLGFETQRVQSHLWRAALDFAVPQGWFSNAGQVATLTLRYAHMAGLEAGSRLQVLVNGRVVRTVPLNATARVIEEGLPIRFDAADLSAGTNRIEFLVERPGLLPDQQCPEVLPPFLEIDAASTLTLPATVKMAIPTVGQVLSLLPASQVVSSTRLAATPDVLTIASALPPEGAVLVEKLVLVSPGNLATALPAETSPYGVKLAAYLARTISTPADRRRPETKTGPSLFSRPDTPDLVQADLSGGLFAAVQSYARQFAGVLRPDPSRDFDTWLRAELGTGSLADGAALILMRDTAPYDLALVMGQNAQAIEVAGAVRAALDNSSRLSGQIAIWRPETGWAAWSDPTAFPILLEPLRLANLPAVTGSYASARPVHFAIGMLLLVMIAAVTASSALYVSREGSQQ